MKLLKLYSSNPNFKTINFNEGMNIVAGLQTSSLSTRTCNGIGKSTSLQLVHLLLGGQLDSKYPSDRTLQSYLSEYGTFSLDFKVGSVPYTSTVNFKSGIYYLNDEKIGKCKTFSSKLSEKILMGAISDVSFKQALNCFARRYLPGRNYYSDALMQQGRPTEDFYQRITNLSLLGLDVSLAKQFKSVREELDEIKKIKDSLQKANLTANESELRDLEDKLERLLKSKANFDIAPNYNELKRDADLLTDEMNKFRNEVFKIERDVRNKERALDESQEVKSVDLDRVEQIFSEAAFHFPNSVQVQLQQAQDFHVRIHSARRERLISQVKMLNDKREHLEALLTEKEERRDSILKDLDSKGALEEFNSIVEHIRTTENKIAELSSYQNTFAGVEKQKLALESKKAALNLKAIEYIDAQSAHIQGIEKKFRTLVRRFYDDHGGAIRIQKNSGDAKYLFDIEPYIQKDSSQGVGEVKIFCYDMLLFELNKKLLGFMAHDSALFGGVDLRQTKMMFKIALEMCEKHGLQYFVNINKDVYEKLISTAQEDDVLTIEDKQALLDGTVLELFDDKPEHTLFGEYFG
ncbi:DUF2326 domain-containing protein [Vibrio parahaemolyticus]|uniref:DUF2326 domain-containing protein n=1 Tax=Vibrio sp. B1FLJ16 TaxID=2751178 RepID=UPI0015F71D73|nr:DUF2326 domain-containing protein [Vibrio sp. B1FLJ16]MDF4665397.1 DUF2326 domain-containing protein [Vibrio parahaemolyticus]CAD7798688.1 hypothetical protein ACOMICROBIO_FLGHMIGD_00378 [Vibrio sp. B1FLJ16]CAD7798721.1 hypothetical protein ACOMICROBIO_EPCKBFOG_00384 [Vibrio sp. B1FLJ16]CAE6883405.1 hypothetical protein ACOMICROBIO_FLGHMIGD_00378 [Vibrio sp. B1FLJ16]CAE6884396.1 hypothetical protein ACOMICROBIO_EPCKBFOG_00384 [Vibrio sp. B1FLJ16]